MANLIRVNGYLRYDLFHKGIEYDVMTKFNLLDTFTNDVEERMDGWSYDECFTDYEYVTLPESKLEEICEYIINQFKDNQIYVSVAHVENAECDKGEVLIDMVYELSITWEQAYEEVYGKKPKKQLMIQMA